MQRHLAKALSLSVASVTRERLPHRMLILLLRLALAQTIRGMIGKAQSERPDESAEDAIEGLRRK
jgi:hypothetical protein